jgi:hypothetical protein
MSAILGLTEHIGLIFSKIVNTSYGTPVFE